jgi:hypothetical protein
MSYTDKEPLIISRTGPAIWPKTNFGPTGHHHPRSSPLPHVCTVPGASGIALMHPGSRVLWECSVLPAVLPPSPQLCQNGSLSILSSTAKQRKVGGGDESCCFGQKFHCEKGSEMCCDATASSLVTKAQGEVFAYSLWTFPLMTENDEHALYFALHLPCLFWSRWVWTFYVHLMFFPERLPNHCQGLRHTFSEICTEFDIHDSKLKDVTNQNVHPAPWNFVHSLPRYASTINYCCIALLQLLYKWWLKGLG